MKLDRSSIDSLLVAIVFNVPNLLTFLRIILSWGVLFFGWKEDWPICFKIFCVAALTDMIDGAIARLFRQRTALGAFIDPLADKLLMFFSFLTLTRAHYLPLALTLLVYFRDLMIIIGLLILKLRKISIPIQPTYLSKFTTLFQILTVISGMLLTQKISGLNPYQKGIGLIWGTTAFLTFATTLQYLKRGIELYRIKPA